MKIIFYLGKKLRFFWGSLKQNLLFNGNNNSSNKDFDKYLTLLGINLKNDKFDTSGYTILKNKNVILAMDTGSNPGKIIQKIIKVGHYHLNFFLTMKN